MKAHQIFIFQGFYYFVTALWALVHIKSFEFVTGKKRNHWLVYTVATLLLSSSLVFLYSGTQSRPIPVETIILSVTNALALTSIDIIFTFMGTIRKIYLLDAAIEILILILVGTCQIW